MNVLILNCWTSSIAFHLLDGKKKIRLADGTVERVTLDGGSISLRRPGREVHERKLECPTHASAVEAVLALLADPDAKLLQNPHEISVVAHRVVHGGEKFHFGCVIDQEVLGSLRKLRALAPLHAPSNIAGIEAAMKLLPGVPHLALFDTAFHHTMPPEAYLYPLPYDWYEQRGIRRYGFHGHAHQHATMRAASILGKPLDYCNLITIAIGRGISVCAVRNGRSIDTSMGLTPLEGVVMDTRCGDLDPGLTTFMMDRLNLSPPEIHRVLNEKSGLYGIAGSGSRIELIERAGQGEYRAQLALDIQCYRLKKQIGAYIAAIGKTDAVVFTAEEELTDWRLREQVLNGLELMGIIIDSEKARLALPRKEEVISASGSPVTVINVPTHLETVMCEEVMQILSA
ncbi:acetate kinase [Geobacter sp. DSM 9736]|uniref:acetate kinase n=1 Tax=Geobacter sp. DSM 9736 TaxID=1277350 RepID=UPI000B5123F9|nr:acetate kinase [Geobacter sp. DSM 9736]SNB47347.1 acetate kinase [Geobacter sp. DSM 9736]